MADVEKAPTGTEEGSVTSPAPEARSVSSPPRRRFLKLAGGLAAAGAAAVAFGEVANRLNPVVKTAVPTIQASTTTATVTETVTEAYTEATPPTATGLVGAERPFSIFWITDTQFLSETNPALYRMLTNWIVNNWARFNGKLVVHTGDLVQDGNVQTEWDNANDAMSILAANGIPYTWCAGNHDDLVLDDATSGWMGSAWAPSLNPQFASLVVDVSPNARWVGDYHNGMDTAVSFTANGLDFLVVNVEWNAQPDVLGWVSGVLDGASDAGQHAIVASHAYIDASGSTDDLRWGPMLADFTTGLTSILDAHSSEVFLTLNGHFASVCGYNTPSPVNNRNELMFDRQDCVDTPQDSLGRGVDNTEDASDSDKVGGATATVLTFDTLNNRIGAKTYDIYPGSWRADPFEEYSVVMFPSLVNRFQKAYPAT